MEEPFQRGRASEDITDFSDLRGLKRHAANRNPVDRSIFGMTEYQREGQQANRTGCHEPAVFLNSGEVSQKDSEHQKQDDSQQNSHELLQEALPERWKPSLPGTAYRERMRWFPISKPTHRVAAK